LENQAVSGAVFALHSKKSRLKKKATSPFSCLFSSPHSGSPSRPFQTSFYPGPLIPFLSPLAGYPSTG
ncbi:MAG: hypothetical protein ACFNP9_04920, partial [Porphyromonas endodontalis]